MIFVVAGVELGGLAGVVFFRADEVGSVTEGLCGGGIATTGLDVTSSFLCFFFGWAAYMSNGFTINNHQRRLKNIKKRKGGLLVTM